MSIGDELKRAFAEAQHEEKVVHIAPPADKAPKIEPIDFSSLTDTEPPPRRFLIQEWLSDGCLSGLYGPGGVGKSLLAQQAATCLATGRDFLGMKVDPTPVLGLFSEDDDDELKRRQWRINQALGLKNKNLEHLHIQGRSGLNNVIVSFPKSAPRKEALYESVVKQAREYEAGLVELDNRAQMLLVEENDRAQATFAANLCAGIAREINGACLLLGHTAKARWLGIQRLDRMGCRHALTLVVAARGVGGQGSRAAAVPRAAQVELQPAGKDAAHLEGRHLPRSRSGAHDHSRATGDADAPRCGLPSLP
jgi:RecA-family ATPase